jgi:hypothetical protein
MSTGAAIAAAANQVLAETPSLKEWAAGKGEAIPARNLKPHLKRSGWPTRLVEAEGTKPVLVVPETWLRRLGELLGLPWERVSRGIVEAEGD